MSEAKHTRYQPEVGDLARITGENPDVIYTVARFETKGKRTRLAILVAETDGTTREVAVSNLLPPMKRKPKVVPTAIELAVEATNIAQAEPNKRNHEKAAAAWLRAAVLEPVEAPKPLPRPLTIMLRLFGVSIEPTSIPEHIQRATIHAVAAQD